MLIDYYDLVDRHTHDGTSCDFAALISDLDLVVSTDSDDGGQWRQGGGGDQQQRHLKLGGHVGFDSLPDQLVNKSVQSGFSFNILCIGMTE